MEAYERLKKIVEAASEDVAKADGGNKAAGTRVRKSMQEVKAADGDEDLVGELVEAASDAKEAAAQVIVLSAAEPDDETTTTTTAPKTTTTSKPGKGPTTTTTVPDESSTTTTTLVLKRPQAGQEKTG